MNILRITKKEKLLLSKNKLFELAYVAPKGELINEWPCFVAYINSKAVAYISFELHLEKKHILWIQNICVIDSKKRSGIGTELVEYAISYAKINKYKKIALYAYKDYTFNFWDSLGFEKIKKTGENLIFEKIVE